MAWFGCAGMPPGIAPTPVATPRNSHSSYRFRPLKMRIDCFLLVLATPTIELPIGWLEGPKKADSSAFSPDSSVAPGCCAPPEEVCGWLLCPPDWLAPNEDCPDEPKPPNPLPPNDDCP